MRVKPASAACGGYSEQGLPPRSKSATANAVPADFGHRKGVVIEFAVALDIPFDG